MGLRLAPLIFAEVCHEGFLGKRNVSDRARVRITGEYVVMNVAM